MRGSVPQERRAQCPPSTLPRNCCPTSPHSPVRAHDRAGFRTGTLALLAGRGPAFDVAFFQSGGIRRRAEPISRGLPRSPERLLARRAVTVWSGSPPSAPRRWRGAAWSMPRAWSTPTRSWDGCCGTERPVRHLCLAALEEGRTVLVLGRAGEPFQRRELELVRLCAPGNRPRRPAGERGAGGAGSSAHPARAGDLRLREPGLQQPGDRRGAGHLATSRSATSSAGSSAKVGVSGRSELVGLAAMATRRARTA